MNDQGATIRTVDPPRVPLGIEVQMSAFAIDVLSDIWCYATFYRYRMVNRSGKLISDAFVGGSTGFWLGP